MAQQNFLTGTGWEAASACLEGGAAEPHCVQEGRMDLEEDSSRAVLLSKRAGSHLMVWLPGTAWICPSFPVQFFPCV